MWKLHRYYLKEVAVNSLLTLVVIFVIVLVSLVSRAIGMAQGGNLLDAGLIVVLFAIDTFPHLLTIGLLFGTVLTFARAAQDREITAIRSAGISPRVPMVSALLMGVVFSGIGAFFMHYAIPYAHFMKYRVVPEMVRSLVINLQTDKDHVELSGATLYFARRDENSVLHDCRIYIKREMPRTSILHGSSTWVADEVWWEVDVDSAQIVLHFKGLRDVVTGTRPGGRQEARFSLRAITEQNRRHEGDKDLSSDVLLAEVARGVYPQQANAAHYTVQRRSCFALMPFLFAPIGFAIGVLARDRGRMTAILFTLIPLGIFYTCDLAGVELLRTTGWVGFAWLPAAVIIVLGTPFCWRLLRL